jgi:hypothetical protein
MAPVSRQAVELSDVWHVGYAERQSALPAALPSGLSAVGESPNPCRLSFSLSSAILFRPESRSARGAQPSLATFPLPSPTSQVFSFRTPHSALLPPLSALGSRRSQFLLTPKREKANLELSLAIVNRRSLGPSICQGAPRLETVPGPARSRSRGSPGPPISWATVRTTAWVVRDPGCPAGGGRREVRRADRCGFRPCTPPISD